MITALIPARSGSKRIPNKNIRKLLGVPLMVYSIKTAFHCDLINEVFVSTDSLSYAEIADKAGADIHVRPPKFATDDATDLDVVKSFLATNDAPDLLVYLRPTTPRRTVTLVEKAISDFSQQNTPTSLRSVHEMSESAYKMFFKMGQILIPIQNGKTPDDICGPNHEYPVTYCPNGYIDIIRPEFVIANNRLWGNDVFGFETPPVIEADNEFTWKLLEYQFAIDDGDERIVLK
jgi:N-acylneuraminate cytidylyltransferase